MKILDEERCETCTKFIPKHNRVKGFCLLDKKETCKTFKCDKYIKKVFKKRRSLFADDILKMRGKK